MFASCTSLTDIDAEDLDTSSAETLAFVFQTCTSLPKVNVSGWDTSHVTSLEQAFSECMGLKTLNISKWDLSSLSTTRMMLEGDGHLQKIDLTPFRRAKNLETVYGMFNQCPNLKSVNVRNIDFSKVTTMAHFLEGCASLKTVDFSGIDFSALTDGSSVFANDVSLKSVSFKGASFPLNTTFMELFSECSSLEKVDFSNVKAPKANTIRVMFGGCTSLRTLDLSGTAMGQISSADSAFNRCNSLTTLDLSGLTAASSGRNFSSIFRACYVDSYKPMQGYSTTAPKAHPSIAKVKFTKIGNQKFTGNYLTPKVVLTVQNEADYVSGDLWGTTLVEGQDYTVSYSNNRKVGTAKVTIRGKGIFTGKVTKTFKIVAR